MYGGALHIGPRPTFRGSPPSIELHLLDFDEEKDCGAEKGDENEKYEISENDEETGCNEETKLK